MTPKHPTEQESKERPLLPFENAKLRSIIRAHERREWIWSRIKIGVGFGLGAFSLFILLRDEILKMVGAE